MAKSCETVKSACITAGHAVFAEHFSVATIRSPARTSSIVAIGSASLKSKSRDLADPGAILVCGIYIDLNQIRAGEALTPETSRHTSAYDRIAGRRQRVTAAAQGIALAADQTADGWLCELTLEEGLTANVRPTTAATTPRRASDKGLLPIKLDEYLELLDSSGRIVRAGKRGAIPDHLAPILARLGVNATLWSELITQFDRWFGHVVGKAQLLADRAASAGRRWYCGRARCADAFG